MMERTLLCANCLAVSHELMVVIARDCHTIQQGFGLSALDIQCIDKNTVLPFVPDVAYFINLSR